MELDAPSYTVGVISGDKRQDKNNISKVEKKGYSINESQDLHDDKQENISVLEHFDPELSVKRGPESDAFPASLHS